MSWDHVTLDVYLKDRISHPQEIDLLLRTNLEFEISLIILDHLPLYSGNLLLSPKNLPLYLEHLHILQINRDRFPLAVDLNPRLPRELGYRLQMITRQGVIQVPGV